ncbi:MAG: tRNA 2-selenouridine(34) synthase MnmH [Pseudohongiella sp.]|nr:tRNA 2-selenouridine(34) synthase MnmH [Pseudohongiella sp.]
MRADTDDFLNLFLNDTPLIDSRAPVEFHRGAFPNTVNLPLMSDREREQVGTCYKEQGQQAAIRLGHELVNGDVKTQRVQSWVSFAEQHPSGYLYCFRGGLRSQICQQWMREAACEYPRVIGGYKAMRRFLLEQLEVICANNKLLVLAGHTGAAKTELLNAVPGAIDLEALANHRGSAFGKRATEQPSQIDFENRLIIAMLKHIHATPDKPIVLEDESRLIGRCAMPPVLRDAMARSSLVRLNSDLESRTEHSYLNYILRKTAEWQQELGNDGAGFDAFVDDLRDSLKRVQKRLGGDRYVELSQMMEQAIDSHRVGDPSLHRDWIRRLLQDYYDPMYDWQWQRHEGRVVFEGNFAAVLDFLNSARI